MGGDTLSCGGTYLNRPYCKLYQILQGRSFLISQGVPSRQPDPLSRASFRERAPSFLQGRPLGAVITPSRGVLQGAAITPSRGVLQGTAITPSRGVLQGTDTTHPFPGGVLQGAAVTPSPGRPSGNGYHHFPGGVLQGAATTLSPGASFRKRDPSLPARNQSYRTTDVTTISHCTATNISN